MSMVMAIIVIHTFLSFVFVSSWMSLAGISSHLFRLVMFFYSLLASNFVSFLFFNLTVFLIHVLEIATVFFCPLPVIVLVVLVCVEPLPL